MYHKYYVLVVFVHPKHMSSRLETVSPQNAYHKLPNDLIVKTVFIIVSS